MADAEKRSNAYQVAIAVAEEASKALRQEKNMLDDDAMPSGTLAKDDTSRLAVVKGETHTEDRVKDEEEEVKPGARDHQRGHRLGRENNRQEEKQACWYRGWTKRNSHRKTR